MISDWSFVFRIKKEEYSYCQLQLIEDTKNHGKYYFSPVEIVNEEILFEMTKPDIKTQTFYIEIITDLHQTSKNKSLQLNIERKYPYLLYIKENEKSSIRWKFQNEKLFAYPEKEINQTKRISNEPLGIVGNVLFDFCHDLYAIG